MADVASLVNGVSELVQIPSVNPLQSHDPALAGERRLAEGDACGDQIEGDHTPRMQKARRGQVRSS